MKLSFWINGNATGRGKLEPFRSSNWGPGDKPRELREPRADPTGISLLMIIILT